MTDLNLPVQSNYINSDKEIQNLKSSLCSLIFLVECCQKTIIALNQRKELDAAEIKRLQKKEFILDELEYFHQKSYTSPKKMPKKQNSPFQLIIGGKDNCP